VDPFDEDVQSVVPGVDGKSNGKDGDEEGEEEKEIDFEAHAQFIIYPDDVIRADLTKVWTKVPTEVLYVTARIFTCTFHVLIE
jgi:hypothetical protein